MKKLTRKVGKKKNPHDSALKKMQEKIRKRSKLAEREESCCGGRDRCFISFFLSFARCRRLDSFAIWHANLCQIV